MPRFRVYVDRKVRYGYEIEARDAAAAGRAAEILRGAIDSGDDDERGDATRMSSVTTATTILASELGDGQDDRRELHLTPVGYW